MERKQLLLDELIAVVRNGESGASFPNPEREYMLRYFITHDDDPSIVAMADDYLETFGTDSDA